MAYMSDTNDDEIGIYETWSEVELAMCSMVEQCESVTVKMIERSDGTYAYEITCT